jgi:hemerythrin-like domain-containing protein
MVIPLSQIGAGQAPSFDEPLDMLEACHGRIEAQLATLEKLGAHVAAHGSDAEAVAAARAVMRYFDTAGVQHHRDEDEELFPLLRALAAKQGREEIGATLYELEREHEAMDALYAKLRRTLEAIEAGQRAALDAGEVARFAWVYRRHIQLEATAVLPFARAALDEEQRRRLGARMAGRRKAPAPP